MEIIDTHCHIDIDAFDADREEVIKSCHAKGINRLVVPAINASGWQKLEKVCQQYDTLIPAFGLHPMFMHEHQEKDIELLRETISTSAPVAVGEIGLDFYQGDENREAQLSLFEKQLEVAVEFNLPVILHVRKAHDQILKALKKYKVKGGFSHAFNGSEQQAKQYIDLGFKLGFGGTLTYPNSNKIHQLAKKLPMESIVLETDAPDMVVASHRGERNSPEYILESLAALAELRGMSLDDVANQTSQNARDVIPQL